MTFQLLANAAIIIAAVAFLGFRQLAWRPVVTSRLWRLPVVLGIIGVVTLANASSPLALSTLDISLLIIEVVVSLGVGAAMGVIARFRPISAADQARYHANGKPGDPVPNLESRTGWVGFALWAVFIVVRIGLDVWATQAGSQLATSTAVILVMIAANRAARGAVVAARVIRLEAVAA
ncbi:MULTISPECIES: hypothetical protein [Subtercola]|uniref:DUF1453 family protein n=1 Tax=Subtercola vilae TaxID=2056433 RepID=A0A4V4RF58_9MICO|nr:MULTISPECIES: hypothetical protein [Subtercola]MEA9985574.1 hypothetical protein [Subtercola sp. RTI3]TIH36324.1 hypothetical protein D4765_10010 [Subtercola vilae]